MSLGLRLPKVLVFRYSLLNSKQNLLMSVRSLTYCKTTLCKTAAKLNIRTSDPCKMVHSREKSSKRIKALQTDIDDNESDDEESDDEGDYNFKGDEVVTYETDMPRVDKIIKLCFRTSRKDIEDMFYQTKVRVNSKILKKKSANIYVGDEIDIINGFVNDNPKLINVNRIEILNIKQNSDNLKCTIKVKKSKSLIVQNYSGIDQWRG